MGVLDVEAYRRALAGLAGRHREELARLVRIPSISAQDTGIPEAADAVVELLEARGMRATIHATPGHPVVTASGGATDAPRLLFYEHYDVQPPEPLEAWSVPPFEVTERDGCLYGRGVADTKAHLICRLAAIDAAREVLGGDPVGYVFLVEGEEEIGSPNLEAFMRDHADELRADGCVWEFGGVDGEGRPVVSLGLKGIVTVELHARGPAYDLHSSLGAVVDNPLYRIAAAVASLRDADGRILVDGFYDDVEPLAAAELAALDAQPDPAPELRRAYGVEAFLGGASGVELVRRLQCEPVVNVNGIHGGYGGPGSKTVLPAEATAKLDVRLVPHQHPERVVELMRAHLDRHGFTDVELVTLAGEPPGRTPLDDPFARLVVRAAELAYELPPVIQVSNPGTGPAHPFRELLGVPFASSGCAYPGSRVHAPDEHIRLEDLETGKLHSALIVAALGADWP